MAFKVFCKLREIGTQSNVINSLYFGNFYLQKQGSTLRSLFLAIWTNFWQQIDDFLEKHH
jgi:hypothetical protein